MQRRCSHKRFYARPREPPFSQQRILGIAGEIGRPAEHPQNFKALVDFRRFHRVRKIFRTISGLYGYRLVGAAWVVERLAP